MGYSHHFSGSLTPLQFREWATRCKVLYKKIAKMGIPIGSGDGEGDLPEFSENAVWFNGIGADSHESFFLEANEALAFREFCKTNKKPYDLMVCLALIAMKQTAPKQISIDPAGEDSDWAEAIEIYQKITFEVVSFEMIKGTANE